MDKFTSTPASAPRCGAATSTPTRSSRPSTSSGSRAPGFEDGLFSAWRNDPSFVLNQDAYKNATVLVAGPDFGTGSSREHAVWALQNYGFKVVISRRGSPTSSAATPASPGCSRRRSTRRSCSGSGTYLEAEPGRDDHRRPRVAHRHGG